eukprot:GHVP01039131.1.p1 GENE.GHVP01039131.1~~GHVP01039131.1.p1  ORF type:complete len:182 (-),score=54.85 GHVP01039131.1:172-717(-)
MGPEVENMQPSPTELFPEVSYGEDLRRMTDIFVKKKVQNESVGKYIKSVFERLSRDVEEFEKKITSEVDGPSEAKLREELESRLKFLKENSTTCREGEIPEQEIEDKVAELDMMTSGDFVCIGDETLWETMKEENAELCGLLMSRGVELELTLVQEAYVHLREAVESLESLKEKTATREKL